MIIGRHGVSAVTSITPEERAIVLAERLEDGNTLSSSFPYVTVGLQGSSSRPLDNYVNTLQMIAAQ